MVISEQGLDLDRSASIRNLNVVRLVADVMDTSTLIVDRTNSEATKLLMSDIDEHDQPCVGYDAWLDRGMLLSDAQRH